MKTIAQSLFFIGLFLLVIVLTNTVLFLGGYFPEETELRLTVYLSPLTLFVGSMAAKQFDTKK